MGIMLRCGRGNLIVRERPMVMGIVNATPDSFYSGSRTPDLPDLIERSRRMMEEGADCLDVGGYSSRPGCADISADVEWARLDASLGAIRAWIGDDVLLSVDTFRADVARRCVEKYGVGIINDISGGMGDPEMFPTVADLKVGYVLMHMRGTPQTMTSMTEYDDVTAEVLRDLAFKLSELRQLGVADVIIDPGFGFAKTTEQNFRLLKELKEFKVLGCPILVGLSRKSMIWRSLGSTPEESLNGTTALNMAALMNGADILRVHDAREAKETISLFESMKNA
ncbi:MAG: dihydropteroate synthase [Muribaculaceae bacterium]|nr:dihydropteroate synthase [Muribaculaceae bacterium]